MKKLLFVMITLVIMPSWRLAEENHFFENENIKCHYQTKDGRINGKYISYYKNGQKKSEGEFKDNYRTGKWTVWDESGRIRMQRDYSDPFTFKRIIPEVSTDPPVTLLNVPVYKLEYNDEGYINNFEMHESRVIWSYKVSRFITEENNSLLFQNNRLFEILVNEVLSGDFDVYESKEETLWYRNIKQKELLNIDQYQCIGYKILEENIFDNERLISEKRIIAICPIAINKETKKVVEIHWVNFSNIRKFLTSEKLYSDNLPEYIFTLDDLFFFHYFSAPIYYYFNPFENKSVKSIPPYVKIDAKESEKHEINIIEAEHDIWISLTR